MILVHSLTDAQVERLYQLYQNEWWCKGRSLKDTFLCIKGSSIIFGIIDDDALIGFARVLTDYIFKAFIFDVIVDPAYRKRGVGKIIINAIKTHEDLQRVRHFELYCRTNMIPYYRSFGFVDNLSDISLMRYVPE